MATETSFRFKDLFATCNASRHDFDLCRSGGKNQNQEHGEEHLYHDTAAAIGGPFRNSSKSTPPLHSSEDSKTLCRNALGWPRLFGQIDSCWFHLYCLR